MASRYLGSDLVTDPNDRAWTVDAWSTDDGIVLTVPLLNFQAGAATPDDGVSTCSPVFDSAVSSLRGDNGLAYPGQDTTLPGTIRYNAFVFAELDRLVIAGAPVDHRAGAPERAQGALVGNSHAFDPLPSPARAPATFHGGAGGSYGTHETRQVDLYYGAADVPLVRNFRYVDTEGSLAPFGGNPP